MRGMVGGDGVNQSVLDAFHQRNLVLFRLDGRIALDAEFHFPVIIVAKTQIMRTSFCRYLLIYQWNVIPKQFQFPCRGNMQDVEFGIRF